MAEKISFSKSIQMAYNLLIAALGIACLVCSIHGSPHPPAATTAAPLRAERSAGSYDNKFDNIDLDEILRQDRLLNNYIKCLDGVGPCTPDGKMLKEILPDAISTDCVKCTEKQKYGAEKVTRHLIDNRPEDWERLEKTYDPEGTYRLKYLASKQAILDLLNANEQRQEQLLQQQKQEDAALLDAQETDN